MTTRPKIYGTELSLRECGWCYLYGIYDFKHEVPVLPPEAHKGTYSAETADGVPYAALSQGKRGGKDLFDRWMLEEGALSLVYPDRVFAWASDLVSEGGRTRRIPVEADRLAELLHSVGLRPSGFWHPVMLQRGYVGGKPVFDKALRAHTDIGVRWYDVAQAAPKLVEAGWEAVGFPESGGLLQYEFYLDMEEQVAEQAIPDDAGRHTQPVCR